MKKQVIVAATGVLVCSALAFSVVAIRSHRQRTLGNILLGVTQEYEVPANMTKLEARTNVEGGRTGFIVVRKTILLDITGLLSKDQALVPLKKGPQVSDVQAYMSLRDTICAHYLKQVEKSGNGFEAPAQGHLAVPWDNLEDVFVAAGRNRTVVCRIALANGLPELRYQQHVEGVGSNLFARVDLEINLHGDFEQWMLQPPPRGDGKPAPQP